MREPKSLQEAIVYFSNPDNCIDYLAIRRWPDGKVLSARLADRTGLNSTLSRALWQC